MVSKIEEVSPVDQADPEALVPDTSVRICKRMGEDCSTDEKQMLTWLLLTKHPVFALLMVNLARQNYSCTTQDRDEGNNSLQSRKLPYDLRAELEAQLTRLEATGRIEQLSSLYVSALVLVRKKDYWVCVDYWGITDTIPDYYPIH